MLNILDIYTYIIIAAVIVSWLVSFGVLNTYNSLARFVLNALYALTEPVLGPIRRALPSLGGLDLSPLIALVGIGFLKYLIRYIAFNLQF
ncbi:MAG: YggT family protein [Proteobacteria bacterium]|nr:YggT family protein [Pseudomonadota bacterium]